ALPMTHIGGAVYGLLLPLACGLKAVLLDTWNAGRALDLIESERVTFISGVPTYLDGLLDHEAFERSRVRTVRMFAMGGTRVTPDDVVRAATTLGCVSKRSYGSTEVPTLTTGMAGDNPSVLAATDGRPIGASKVRVIDAAGADAGIGCPG